MPTKSRKKDPPTPQAVALEAALEDSTVPAVSRAGAILRLLGRSPEPLGVQTIARSLGLIPSTCLHILRSLVSEEMVSVDEQTKQYSLGVGLLTLAGRWMNKNHFIDLAQPTLDQFSQKHAVTSIGVEIVGLEHMVIVAIARADNMFQLHAHVGSRFPALISATGRCIAAFGNYPKDEIRARFKQLRWDVAPGLAVWEGQVEQTRANGFAIDAGNYMAGVTVMAAPVFGINNRLSNALVAIGISEQLRATTAEKLARELHKSAKELSVRLGGGDGTES